MALLGTFLQLPVFLGTGCGAEVDWWALGCILYEFLIGITPFYGDTMEEIFENILIIWRELVSEKEHGMGGNRRQISSSKANFYIPNLS